MISRTYFNNWAVFKSALKRLKWLSILYGVVLFLQVPLILWMELGKQKAIQENNWLEFINSGYFPNMVLFQPIEQLANIAVAIVFGLILFYYLQNDRPNTFFHSLPIKRWSLYIQKLLAGLTLIWLPLVINGLLVYGIFKVFGVTELYLGNQALYYPGAQFSDVGALGAVPIWQVAGYWLAVTLLMTGIFFVFTVFVGMFTGNVLLQGALTLIGLVLPLGLYVLVNYNFGRLLYGYTRAFNDRSTEWLSPLVIYLSHLNNQLFFTTKTWYSWYFVVAVILCGASILLYKSRNAEAAGETLANRWIRGIFKYGVATCMALTVGLYFSTFDENSTGYLYFGYLVGAVLGYIIADMIAYKSFRFYHRWKQMLVFGAIFLLLVSFIQLDLFGYEKYVPDQGKVKEVYVNIFNREGVGAGTGLKEETNIGRVRQLHQQIIMLEEENKALERAFRATNGRRGPADPSELVMPVDITYVLNNGKKVKRTYSINLPRYREILLPIFETDEVKKSMFGYLYKIDEREIDQINVYNHRLGKNVRIYKQEEVAQAMAALKKDILNISFEAALEGSVPSPGSIDFITKTAQEKYSSHNLSYYEEFKNFEAFLAEGGYLEELFLSPEKVSHITLRRAGSDKSMEITDKEIIKGLLNWCYLEDERAYNMRQQQSVTKEVVEYYGRIELTEGSPMYVWFDYNPHALKMMKELFE